MLANCPDFVKSLIDRLSVTRFAEASPPAQALSIRLNHLLRMLAGSVGERDATQHAGYFFRALFAHDGADTGPRTTIALLLLDHKVMVRERRDLRQMGHA